MLGSLLVLLAIWGALVPRGLAAQDAAPPPCLSFDQQSAEPAPRPQGALFLDAFTPFDATPVLQNRDDMAAALEREYPAAHRAAGVGGQTYLWILIDPGGVAREARVNITSGCPELDDAAMRAAEVMRFTPAVYQGRTVPVWIPIAIDFDPDQAAEVGNPVPPKGEETPGFTPFDVAPRIQNRDEVAAALRREYPRALREGLASGRTVVWMRVNGRGGVEDVQVNATSGNPDLDQAALRVARVFRFSPAIREGFPVPVWVAIPIQFQP